MFSPSFRRQCEFLSSHVYLFNILTPIAYSLIPVAIVGAKRFYETLVNVLSASTSGFHFLSVDISFQGVIGYWSTAFAAIILTEHLVFRRGQYSSYSVLTQWDQPRKLPPGLAAVFTFACAFGIIVPSMSQVWYIGPLPEKRGTGDIAVITGFAVAVVVYLGVRSVEKRFTNSR
jgi:purine-cytosine permease-like protein